MLIGLLRPAVIRQEHRQRSRQNKHDAAGGVIL